MKNLLIATTALVATAGVAAADVSLSGAANFGVINTGGAADTVMYNNVSVTAAMSGETDGGLTFGASLTMRSGDDVDLDVGDITIDRCCFERNFIGQHLCVWRLRQVDIRCKRHRQRTQ